MAEDTQQVLRELQKAYNLKEKEILILKSLRYDIATAEKICEITKIPVGRVYSYLNNLVTLKLIDRTSKKPYLYEIKDFNKNVIQFMKSSRDKIIQKESEIMRLMKGPSSEHIETLDTKEQFTQYHLNILAEGQHIRIVCVNDSFPFLLYPPTWDAFRKMRQLIVAKRRTISFTDNETAYLVFKSYHEALEQGKKFEVILEKATFDKHIGFIKDAFGPKYVENFIDSLRKKMTKYGINAYLLDEDITMQVDLNENRAGLSLRNDNMTFGIVIFSEKVVQIYKTSFEQKKSRGIHLIDYISLIS